MIDWNTIISLLPVPQTLFQITWTLIGLQLGHSFGKINSTGVDEYIQEHGTFKGWTRFIIERILHFTHHYWLGLLLIIYYPTHNIPELLWLGLGLFLEDSIYHTGSYIKTKLNKITIK